MTSFKTALAAFALLSTLGAAPAFAAVNDAEPVETERECSFKAELGGYVCESFNVGGSLSDLGDGNGKKKLKLPPIKIVVKI